MSSGYRWRLNDYKSSTSFTLASRLLHFIFSRENLPFAFSFDSIFFYAVLVFILIETQNLFPPMLRSNPTLSNIECFLNNVLDKTHKKSKFIRENITFNSLKTVKYFTFDKLWKHLTVCNNALCKETFSWRWCSKRIFRSCVSLRALACVCLCKYVRVGTCVYVRVYACLLTLFCKLSIEMGKISDVDKKSRKWQTLSTGT